MSHYIIKINYSILVHINTVLIIVIYAFHYIIIIINFLFYYDLQVNWDACFENLIK